MADVDQSVSAIDDKSNENNSDSSTDENQSDWVGFAKSLVYNFLHIIVFIIIGSNFIFFTYYDSLDLIFPFSSKVYFPGKKQNGGGKSISVAEDRVSRFLNLILRRLKLHHLIY